MEDHIIPIITLIYVGLVVSHATITPELYWKKNCQMRRCQLRNSLPSDVGKPNENGPTKRTIYADTRPLEYDYVASKAQLEDDPTKALFFLKKDIKLGHNLTIHLTKSTNKATFIPRHKAQSLPFSTDKIPQILQEFSVKPGSTEAQMIKETINGCERKGIQGEQKYCATSLEDMIDYAKSTLGNNVKAILTEINKSDKNYNKGGKYTISGIDKLAKDGDVLVCHKKSYAYSVFYCHVTKGTSSYILSLENRQGGEVKVVGVCHKDTRGWNPKHLAFHVLNVEPGSNVSICHFLPDGHIVWIRN